MGRKSNYDTRGFQHAQGGESQQGGGVFGRLQQQPQQQQQQRQDDARQGSWGRGYRGDQGQQDRNQKRFGAFSQEQDDRWAPNQPQGRGGGQRGNHRQQAVDWRAVVRDDVKNEQAQPPWPFTCYAHQRDKANDMVGDFQYEEVRWYQMEAAKSGKSMASLLADFNASGKAQEQHFQALLRMNRPPSLSNVPPEEPPNPFTAQQNPFQPATPFGQIVGAFGSNPAAVPPTQTFDGGFAPSPAQSMPSVGPFGSSSTVFGHPQQTSQTKFGSQAPSQAPSAFGQPAAFQQSGFLRQQAEANHPSSSFSTGQGAIGRPANPSSAFGGGSNSAAGTGFGSQQQQQPPAGAFGSSGFQVGSSPAGAVGTPQKQEQAGGISVGATDNPWLAQSFQRGQIPEMPPPPELYSIDRAVKLDVGSVDAGQNQPNDGQASLLSTDGTSTPENPYVEDMTSREEHAQQFGKRRTSKKDLEASAEEERLKNQRGWRLVLLGYQSIGVVYGGLGTSPLYVFPNIFADEPSKNDVLGAMSLIFWILSIVVLLKYVIIVLHANDNGEGGTFAMYSLLCRHARISAFSRVQEDDEAKTGNAVDQAASGTSSLLERSRPMQKAVLAVVLIGTAFMMCDGVLSPAASVMSAMAGIQTVNANISNDAIAGISCAVLLALFSVQRYGTGRIGTAFSPVLILWFITNAAIGIYNIARYMPDVFKAISPHYAFRYFFSAGQASWASLNGILLCVSGSEALFADMGHFSHRAITVTTLGLVYPSLLLIYFGEAAYLGTFPSDFAHSYFAAIPQALFWPMFVIATVSALVGSQSLITSAFSVARQSAVMSCFPPVRVVHTGKHVEGQIYLPEVNWALCLLGIAAVAGFRNTVQIGYAFSVVVVAVMVITTVLVSTVMLVVWQWHWLAVAAIQGSLFIMETVLLSAVLYKVPEGGWFPLAIATVVLCMTAIWHWGSLLRLRHSQACSARLVEDLIHDYREHAGARSNAEVTLGTALSGESATTWESAGRSISRVPGMAIYISESSTGLPAGFVSMLRSVGVVHTAVIFLTVQRMTLPTFPEEECFEVEPLAMPGFFRVLCRVGYTERLVRNAAFLESMNKALVEDIRFRALAAKWSAAEIYNTAQGRRSSLGVWSPRSGASLNLNRQHANNRSMRSINVAEQSHCMGACTQGPSEGQAGSSVLDEGADPLSGSAVERNAPSSLGAADLQQCSEDSAVTSECEQLGMQGSTVHCRRRGSLSPRHDPNKEDCGASSSGLGASTGHKSAGMSGESEVSDLLESRRHGLTFALSHCVLRAAEGSSLARRLLIDNVYRTLQLISFDPMNAWANISPDVLDIQITYNV